MKILNTWTPDLSSRQLQEAVATLKVGETILLPLDEGRWALACDAIIPRAVKSMLGAAGKDASAGILCADLRQASDFVRIPNEVFSAMKRSTPGPETYRFEVSSKISRMLGVGKELGIMIPPSEAARQIAAELGSALAMIEVAPEESDPELVSEEFENRAVLMIAVNQY